MRSIYANDLLHRVSTQYDTAILGGPFFRRGAVSENPSGLARIHPESETAEPRRETHPYFAYLLVHSTPSFADGALARSLMMPAPTEKSKTFCQPSGFMLPQGGIAGATIE